MNDSNSKQWLPNKDLLVKQYESYISVFEIVLERLEELLKQAISISSAITFKSRVKNFKSYYRKLLRNINLIDIEKEELPVITDILGIRIICPFLQDLRLVENCLKECFSIVEVERKGADRTFREFGYESTHILLEIPSELFKEFNLPKKLLFEIQIRTILQDAWAEVEHELVYKSEFSPFDLPLKRKLASINASLSLADIIFQEIRDYQNKLNTELDKRRGTFYKQADQETEPFFQDMFHRFENSGDHAETSLAYVQGTIDDMILDAIEAHNNGNLAKAINIYSKILEKKPNDTVMSVMFKHRGMAYFAQSNYKNALEDFKKSAEFSQDNFRAYYYIGIVYSVTGEDHKAVEQFDISLKLNPYQPYVYYRRAQSLYNMGLYTEALRNLDSAVDLGYDREDEKVLRMSIASKIDTI